MKRTVLILLIPFALFLVSMTVARAAFGNQSAMENLLLYGGDQPYFFSRIFNDSGIAAQRLGGRLSFRYLFPIKERVQDQMNNHISTDVYLNQFGGLPGSFYIDFGYSAIIVILLFSILAYLIIKNTKRIGGHYPFHMLLFFYFLYQICFMNIFYFDFTDLYQIFFPILFILVSLLIRGTDRKMIKNSLYN